MALRKKNIIPSVNCITFIIIITTSNQESELKLYLKSKYVKASKLTGFAQGSISHCTFSVYRSSFNNCLTVLKKDPKC